MAPRLAMSMLQGEDGGSGVHRSHIIHERSHRDIVKVGSALSRVEFHPQQPTSIADNIQPGDHALQWGVIVFNPATSSSITTPVGWRILDTQRWPITAKTKALLLLFSDSHQRRASGSERSRAGRVPRTWIATSPRPTGRVICHSLPAYSIGAIPGSSEFPTNWPP